MQEEENPEEDLKEEPEEEPEKLKIGTKIFEELSDVKMLD